MPLGINPADFFVDVVLSKDDQVIGLLLLLLVAWC